MPEILASYNNGNMEIAVDKHSNMLIIGKAATRYSYKTISYEDDYNTVLKNYGDSDLTSAFKVAKDNDVEFIFLLNIQDNFDLFSVIEDLKQNDFTYIVPINLLISDYYYDTYNNNRKTYYIEYLLDNIRSKNESIFVLTDKHASLYEDQDAFLEDMNNISHTIDESLTSKSYRENLIFVANNLQDYPMANVILASALCTTDMSIYPTANFGDALFMIDEFDTAFNFAYFKNHIEVPTTVENLLNFKLYGPEKIVTIQRIIKLIKRELELSEFIGRLYTEYQRIQIYKRIEAYLRSLVDYVIYSYDITSVKAYKDKNNPCTVIVICDMKIQPKDCLEKCSIQLGIEVG